MQKTPEDFRKNAKKYLTDDKSIEYVCTAAPDLVPGSQEVGIIFFSADWTSIMQSLSVPSLMIAMGNNEFMDQLSLRTDLGHLEAEFAFRSCSVEEGTI